MFDIQETTNNADCSFTTKLEDKNVVDIGSDVTLSCRLDKEYSVRWYKDQCEISMNDKFKIKDERGEHKLIIADIQEEDSGVYYCKCGTTKTRCELKVEDCSCSFTTKLEDITVIGIGSDVTLSCCMNKEYDVRWYKDQREIFLNDKFKFKDQRCKHKLIIADIQEKDSGVYSCETGTTKTSCVLKVEDCSCSFTTKLEDMNVIGIGSDITLSCCLDKQYDVRWYKDQREIFLKDRFKFKDERFKHQLIIADIQEADSGVYSCQCGRTKTSCVLKVKANILIKQLENVSITTDQKLILTCKMSAKCKNVKWCKTNGIISYMATTTDYSSGGSNAHMYKLELNPVKMEDAGEYSCHIENVITTCNVMVTEIKELYIDTSLETTTLLHELSSTKEQLEVTEDELNKTAKDVVQEESIIEKQEKEIEKLRALLQKKEDTIKRKESELENNAHCIKELKDENKKLAESAKELESKQKELESNKQLLAQMKEQIEKLEAEKKDLEGRVSSLESDIKNSIKQQQKIIEQLEEGSKQQQKANKQRQKDSKEQKELLNEIKAKMEASEQREAEQREAEQREAEQRKSSTCSVS